MNWEEVKKWDYVVDSVALEYHRKFDMVEISDLRQSLWLWFAEHPNKLKEWEAIGERDAKNLIYRSLRNQAIDYCQRWKAKSVGYDVSDLYYYAPEVIEAILPAVLRQEYGVQHKLNLGRVGRPSAPNEGGNLMVLMLEIDAAYYKLNKDDRKLIFLRHAESMDFKEISNVLSLASEDTSRMRYKRALNRLIRRLGGHKPYNDYDLPSEDEVESTEDSNVSQDE
jgi:DNA-directed RNA polymerase specialized sigma24 family protein